MKTEFFFIQPKGEEKTEVHLQKFFHP